MEFPLFLFLSFAFVLSVDTTENILDTARFLHLFYFISSNISIHGQDSPEPSLPKYEYVSVSAHMSGLQYLTHHWGPLVDSLQHFHVWSAEEPSTDTALLGFPPVLDGVKNHLPRSAGSTGDCWPFLFAVRDFPSSVFFLAKLLSSHLLLVPEVIPPQGIGLGVPFVEIREDLSACWGHSKRQCSLKFTSQFCVYNVGHLYISSRTSQFYS